MKKKPTLVAICGGGAGVVAAEKRSDTKEFYDAITIDVLARTMWGEARGQGDEGLQAVANVVLNRVAVAQAKGNFWWGHNIVQVCQKPYQFSCWNRSDPNFRKLQAVDERDLYFATCLRVARRAAIDALDDVTCGATHYHANYVSPYWIKGEKPCAVIGDHIFYKLVEV